MPATQHSPENIGSEYAEALQGEGDYWDNFIARYPLRGELPGSIDWRLTFTQFRYKHKWLPFCLGPAAINFRMQEINYILTTAVPRPGMRVLDLGCGAGWLSLELARRGAHVTGVDISPTNLAIARHMAETNARNFPYLYQRFAGLPCKLEEFGSVEYTYGDLNTLDLPTNEYDAVVVWDSLHHVANIERLLNQVRGALKPGGVFMGVDHTVHTKRTEDFNAVMLPLLEESYEIIRSAGDRWPYDALNELAQQADWGPLAVDYDNTPVRGFGPFLNELLAEILAIVRENQAQGTGTNLQTDAQHGAGAGEESPFEDVSVDNLMSSLLEEFHAERFHTVCPFLEPEKHIPHYRNESERIFQHYLAAALIRIGERAIERGQTDGQWFLFHLTSERLRYDEMTPAMERMIAEQSVTAYISRLEKEVERKEKAIAELESRVRRYEDRLVTLNLPALLPWKRRKPSS
jgi:2-polyprenyl-3-methyl-5-hydroxy-6-metoxy-1,4-benzoquinol methylase